MASKIIQDPKGRRMLLILGRSRLATPTIWPHAPVTLTMSPKVSRRLGYATGDICRRQVFEGIESLIAINVCVLNVGQGSASKAACQGSSTDDFMLNYGEYSDDGLN